ncbi:GDSL-type esterase/lipase family protein [Paenibacillus sp. NPDC058071]|uniref:GDSL-type esterase/lipase family protein n=1 Tax=Paenibacillus sp. NPDC058071 TaxID=3346326 RepID=UPI0036DD2A63
MFDQLSTEAKQALLTISSRMLEKSKKNRLDAFSCLNTSSAKQGIVFIGDSITEQFPMSEMLQSNLVIYNRGIGGFTTSELLQNLQVMLYDLEPSKVFLMIGTNDLGRGSKPEQIALQIEKICAEIQEKLPQAELLVESVYPVNEQAAVSPLGIEGRSNEQIIVINERIQEICTRMKLTYIPVYAKLINEDGALEESFTTDGLHLNVRGYEIVRQALSPFI